MLRLRPLLFSTLTLVAAGCSNSATDPTSKPSVPVVPAACQNSGGVVQFASGISGVRYWCSNGTNEFRPSEPARAERPS
ncbi:hypothetical protein GN316_08460 [Xylophilus sp. Kf1]|nr:hypothetical protein [Xylophilus sp. Kf1]